MPGAAYDDDDDEVAPYKLDDDDDQLWAQRCKLYIFRAKAKNWVQIGIGKGSLKRTMPAGRVEFMFEEEALQIPMAKHLVETASSLQQNAGTDKGWSWTAFDSIQVHDGHGNQWFTAKFATRDAAQSFKDAFDQLKGNRTMTGMAPPSALPASPGVTLGMVTGSPVLSPRASFGALEHRHLVLSQSQISPRPLDGWLLYFEKGVIKRGSSVRETSTIYIGVYDSKDQALVCAVRAMDAHCDRNMPWRVKSCWDRVEDRRDTVGEKGVVISVQNADGTFNHVKLRKVHFNLDMPRSGLPEGGDLWDIGE